MDYSELAPDVRQKLLALAMFTHANNELDLDSKAVRKTIEHVVRDSYIELASQVDDYNLSKQWDASNAAASDKTYKE